jgi:nucleoid DNA-binding protein
VKNEKPKRWVSFDEMVRAATGEGEFRQGDVRDIVREIFWEIRVRCLAGERVYVPGFGVFRPVKRASRVVRNPQTKELMTLPELHSFSLRASKDGAR